MIKNSVAPDPSVLDASALNRLRHSAASNTPEAARAAAQQFEAMFLGMVMKSMREATPSEGLFGSEQGKMMTGMLDQQMAQSLATRGVGLADVLVRQMTPQKTPPMAPQMAPQIAPQATPQIASQVSPQIAPPLKPPLSATEPAPSAGSVRRSTLTAFTEKLGAQAEAVSVATGIPARFMLAQAALESGWGRREIKHPDGSSSHNVFGIKADRQWKGKTAEVMTTEYVNGVPEKRLQRFRAYDSYAEAFSDYASMLTRSPRYAQVIASADDATTFARGLQKAGYATDPGYADKLIGVIRRV